MPLWSELCRTRWLKPTESSRCTPHVECGASFNLLLTETLTTNASYLAPGDSVSRVRPTCHITKSHTSVMSTSWEKNKCDTRATPPHIGVQEGHCPWLSGQGNAPQPLGTRPDVIRARCWARHHFRVRLTPWQPMVSSGYTQPVPTAPGPPSAHARAQTGCPAVWPHRLLGPRSGDWSPTPCPAC
jgi:hypothetical protein